MELDQVEDSKEFQTEIMGKIPPPDDADTDISPSIEAMSSSVDSKDFQKDLLGSSQPSNNIPLDGKVSPSIEAMSSSVHSKDFQKDLLGSSQSSNNIPLDGKVGGKRSNSIPLDAYFSTSSTEWIPSKNKKGDTPTLQPSCSTECAEDEVMAKKGLSESQMHIKEECIVKQEEGCLRELEEGELPEDVEESNSNSHVSVVKKYRPIDYDHFNRKRKVALLISYSGAAFHGMQKNPDVETIELRLMEALAKMGAIRPDLIDEFLNNNNNQISFNRAARTDKGVSAVRQVVSLKLLANETFLTDVNKHLPNEIRVFGIERVTKSFDAKCSCSGRSYEYLVPSIAFAPSKDIMDSTYRLSDEQFCKMNSILEKYVGTHNFHNFTSGKRFTDKSAMRYITEFKGSKPFEIRGHEFVSLEVHGQSFLIHQIRKMIGLCIAICRGYCNDDTIDNAWEAEKLDIPKAPGLGLLLSRVSYKAYNQKFGVDGLHNPLTWEDCELNVERYKIENLWHTIIEEEIKKSSIVTWLKTLSNHTYSCSGMQKPMNPDYRGRKGVFPALDNNRRDK